MNIDIFNTKGEKTGKINLPKEIFGIETSSELIAQAVRVYLANQRTARAKTKTRGGTGGSGRKIWRQKGTGRARHGDKQAPIFVGGGIAHGPKGVLKRLMITKKMRRKALLGVLSEKVKEKRLLVVDGFDKIKPKTKGMAKIIEKFSPKANPPLAEKTKNQKLLARAGRKTQIRNEKTRKQKILLVLGKEQERAVRAARNIAELEIAYFNQLNCYQVLKNKLVIFSKEALKHFNRLNK